MDISFFSIKIPVKLLIFIILLFSSVMFWDVSHRLIQATHHNETKLDSIDLQTSQITQLEPNELEMLKKSYQTLGKTSTQTQPTQELGMSLVEQQNQRGELKELFSGEFRIRLVAIITPDNVPFVVVAKQRMGTTVPPELIKLALKQQLLGYSLSRVFQTKAVFESVSDVQRTVVLSLYEKSTTQ